MSLPLVSIIIPVYNGELYVGESIQSALQQTWEHKEIIVVDDGSLDNSYLMAKSFEGPDVLVLRQENQGAAVARNLGLDHAKGKYIQFLDADDLLSPDKISAQMDVLQGFPEHLSVCQTVHFQNGSNHLNVPSNSEWYEEGSDDPFDFLLKLYSGPMDIPGFGGMIQPNAWLTPRSLINKAGYWKAYRCPDDDGEFFCRVVLASKGIKYSKLGTNYYRKFNSGLSLSSQKSLAAFESIFETINLKYQYLKNTRIHPLLDPVMGRHFFELAVATFPRFLNLSSQSLKKAKHLGFKSNKYSGGAQGKIISRLFGWRLARLLSYIKHQI